VQSAPPPACLEVVRLFLVFILLQPSGNFEKRAEQRGAIVVHEFDEAGLLYEAAEFDEVSGACAPILDPLALIVAGACESEPIAQHGQALELGRCDLQFLEQGRRLWLSSPACRLAERRPARARSTS